MATNRTVILSNGEIYHIYNRGLDKRTVFYTKREYERIKLALWYYRFFQPGKTLSGYLELPSTNQPLFTATLNVKPKCVSLLAYCLMPNHFHLIVRQELANGISTYVANISNSYTKYFDAKHKREGPLFQGTFKAVHVESDEQFIHLTRYIHLNPVTAFMIKMEDLKAYPWSSYRDYLGITNEGVIDMDITRSLMNLDGYADFVSDQAACIRQKDIIANATIDN